MFRVTAYTRAELYVYRPLSALSPSQLLSGLGSNGLDGDRSSTFGSLLGDEEGLPLRSLGHNIQPGIEEQRLFLDAA
jgi:hypothetical protein